VTTEPITEDYLTAYARELQGSGQRQLGHYPRCPACPHLWHGLHCPTCSCPASWREKS
jgi:hypothetical protein